MINTLMKNCYKNWSSSDFRMLNITFESAKNQNWFVYSVDHNDIFDYCSVPSLAIYQIIQVKYHVKISILKLKRKFTLFSNASFKKLTVW